MANEWCKRIASGLQPLTCLIFGEHKVEYEVASELVAVLASHLSVQHLQLTLTLIELGVVRLGDEREEEGSVNEVQEKANRNNFH